MKKIVFTVTNDISYDQRMHRICATLAAAGYDVLLVGRKRKTSIPLQPQPYQQHRLKCFFDKGKLFYAEYNLRLFFCLFTVSNIDAICAIDLDTILPCLFISKLKKVHRIYDAHELFTEMKEVHTRPAIKKFWLFIERYAVPQFKNGYTVSEGLAEAFRLRYQVEYTTIRNVPTLQKLDDQVQKEHFIVYQGAVNEGRGLEYLLQAMAKVDIPLVICGDGNFMQQLKTLITNMGLETKIVLKGMLPPSQLFPIAQQALIGMGQAEKEGYNQLYALPNKFFDYLHAGLPQVAMNFPEYKKLNDQYQVAILIDDLEPDTIATAINNLLQNHVLYKQLQENCLKARVQLNWQKESEKLILFYQNLFSIA